MTVKGPTRALPYPLQVIDCEHALEAEFHALHDSMVATGLSETSAADLLLLTSELPQISDLERAAVDVGWPEDIVRRAVKRLAKSNVERVNEGSGRTVQT